MPCFEIKPLTQYIQLTLTLYVNPSLNLFFFFSYGSFGKDVGHHKSREQNDLFKKVNLREKKKELTFYKTIAVFDHFLDQQGWVSNELGFWHYFVFEMSHLHM